MQNRKPTHHVVPNTNSPPQRDEPRNIVTTFGGTPTLREHKNKLIYDRADMTSAGEVWNQTTNSSNMMSSARTTFWSFDVDQSKEEKYSRLWAYQMGRRQTYEDSRMRNIVRSEAVRERCDAILQSCEVPEHEREIALRNVGRWNLNSFSRHYEGADGACVGFALLELCDSPESAKDTEVAERAQEVVPNFDVQKVEGLIELVFREYERGS